MRASELIAQLAEKLKEYGDGDIYVAPVDDDPFDELEIKVDAPEDGAEPEYVLVVS